MKDELLILEGIKKSFGDRVILSDLSLTLERGCIYSLMGANGSGKTTLFNVINGYLRAEKGSISFNGVMIDKVNPAAICKLGISRSFQKIRIIRELTVKENLLLAFKFNKGEKLWRALSPRRFWRDYYDELNAEAKNIAERVLLSNVINRKAGEISYGQQKLLTLGCCIANSPKLLLLDEPVAGINAVLRQSISDLVKSLGVTVLLIEHHSEFVKLVSDRILYLENGSLIQYSSFQDLKANLIRGNGI